MGNGYPAPQGVGIDELSGRIRGILVRVRELETMRGSQIYESVKELRSIVENLEQTIEDLSSSGATWYGPVSSGGGDIATTSGYIFTPAGYGFDITYTRRAAWLGNDGRLGWASSSIEKKNLVDDVPLPDPLVILEISDSYYTYMAEIDKRDNPDNSDYDPDYRVHLEYGHIAEWLHNQGLWQAVAYDENAVPVGVHDGVLAGFAIRAAKYVWQRHQALEVRVAKLEGQG